MYKTKYYTTGNILAVVKKDRRIKGFVYKQNNNLWYAFGKPSQDCYIGFKCRDVSAGIASIEMKSF